MNLGQELIRELIENTEYNELGYYEHHAEQNGKHPEVYVAKILLVRMYKETGYDCEYPGDK